jgi:4-amino-4-deoxy-L-arabinose transferase-like glycosyltransferase
VLFIIGIIIRLQGIRRDIFMDEAFTYFFSLKPFTFIIGGNDVHPPLHYLFIKPFAMLFSNNIYMLRLTSLCFWGMFILMAHIYIKERWGKDVAMYSTIFLTLNPTLIYYSTELRMYMLLMFLFIWNLRAYGEWMKDTSNVKNTIYFMIPSVLMAYTHIFSGIVIMIELGYSQFKKVSFQDLLTAFGGILAWSAPSIALIASVYLKHPTFHFIKPNLMSIISAYSFMFTLPTQYFFIYFFLVIALVIYTIKLDIDFKGMGFYGIFLILPFPLFIFAQFTNIYHHRFMIFMIVPIAIFIGYIINKVKEAGKGEEDIFIGLIIIGFFFTFGTTNVHYFGNVTNTNLQFAEQYPNLPIIHQYPTSYLPYLMVHNNSRDYLIGEYDFTFCGSVINPDDKIIEFPSTPYLYVNFTYKYNEFRDETIVLVNQSSFFCPLKEPNIINVAINASNLP